MTKKKRNHPDVEEILSRPWCYYCERDFDDLKILINHQKAKHFKCERCGRRLNTAGGLSVHMSQVHKENLTAVDNALPNRAGLDIEIFGMEGIPEDIAQQHTQRVLTNYHQAQADRRGGGGGAPGSNASAPKKPKLESVSDLKKRLAEHKAAKLAGEKENGGSSGGTTPKPAASVATQAQPQAPTAASPGYSGYQQPPYAAPPTNGSYNQSPSYAQPPAVAASAPYQAPPAYASAVSPSQMGGYGQAPTPQPGQPSYGQVPPVSYPPQPYPQPSQSPFQPHQPSMGYPQPSFSPPPYQVPYSGQSYPGQAGMPPRPFGPGSSAPGFAQQMPHHRAHSPATNANFPAPVRTGSVSLPSAPGLPQRPAFGAPPVNAFQFQQLHQGQMPAPQAHALPPQYPPQQLPPSAAPQPPPQSNVSAPPHVGEFENASTLDDLIKDAQDKAAADNGPTTTTTTATHPAPTPLGGPALAKEEVSEEKGAKKDKEKEKPKSTRLVYSDNETSPEEKMAMMAKYAFTPAQKTIMV